jgi:hypothetical protein
MIPMMRVSFLIWQVFFEEVGSEGKARKPVSTGQAKLIGQATLADTPACMDSCPAELLFSADVNFLYQTFMLSMRPLI